MGCHNLWVGRTGHGKAETRPKEKPQSQVSEYITKLMWTADSTFFFATSFCKYARDRLIQPCCQSDASLPSNYHANSPFLHNIPKRVPANYKESEKNRRVSLPA